MNGNYLIVLAMVGAIYTLFRIDRERAFRYHAVIKAWLWILGGVAVGAAWFAISRDTADPLPPSMFNSNMYEWRWLMKLGVAEAITWGAVSFMAFLLDYSLLRRIAWLLGLNMVAYLAGWIGG